MFRVLIADDDPALREALSEALHLDGLEVRAVADGFEACRSAAAESFDVIISDVHMPGNGRWLLERLRQVQPETPVILMTAEDESAARQEALAAGAFDYVVKPVTLPRLRRTLTRAFAGRRAAATLH